MNQLSSLRFHHLTSAILLLLLITTSIHCAKTGNNNSNNNSGNKTTSGALLSKVVVVGANASGVPVDSMVSNYQYNSSNQITGVQQNTTISDSGATTTTSLNYAITWSGSLPSGLTGTFTETVQYGALNESGTIAINTTFQSSGGQIVSYVQHAGTTSGTLFIPPTQITGDDSALLTYDAGGNLTQSVEMVYAAGIQTNTYSTVYQYNTKLAAAPLYFYPGIAAISTNDLTQTTNTETGTNPGSVTTVPASTVLATENITYTYQ